jgi:hypothetical protein
LIRQSTSIETQEEIDEWIKQRKANFPSSNKTLSSNRTEKRKLEEESEEGEITKKKCKFFGKGKCKKGDDCPFEHETRIPVQPIKQSLFEKVLMINKLTKPIEMTAEEKQKMVEAIRYIVKTLI